MKFRIYKDQFVPKRAPLPHMAAIFSNVRASFIHGAQSYRRLSLFLLFQDRNLVAKFYDQIRISLVQNRLLDRAVR